MDARSALNHPNSDAAVTSPPLWLYSEHSHAEPAGKLDTTA